MPKNGKSNSFLLGRIYERTEVLPKIGRDLDELKNTDIPKVRESILKNTWRITKLEKSSFSYNFVNGIRIIIKLICGK